MRRFQMNFFCLLFNLVQCFCNWLFRSNFQHVLCNDTCCWNAVYNILEWRIARAQESANVTRQRQRPQQFCLLRSTAAAVTRLQKVAVYFDAFSLAWLFFFSLSPSLLFRDGCYVSYCRLVNRYVYSSPSFLRLCGNRASQPACDK